MLLLALAFPQYRLSARAIDASEPEHFYAWAFSLLSQVIIFIVGYTRYADSRITAPALSAAGSAAWLTIAGSAGVLAAWGTWCLLFAEDRAGMDQGKIRSSGWLFPTKEKRASKVERREKRYGKLAME